ncbi:unnamed protein product [Linum tenue]|uniref:Uncharacterized protein n=1 Tax=Linum tenue TaxID=586396 RepID=A0AAV0PXE7_9ROSI|nr:unnamed protein product [Linum tenue]
MYSLISVSLFTHQELKHIFGLTSAGRSFLCMLLLRISFQTWTTVPQSQAVSLSFGAKSVDIVDRDKRMVEKFELDPTESTPFETCESIWKLINHR